MRSMKKMGSIVGLAVAVVALAGAASASASPLITPAGTAFSGTSTGEHVFSISSNIKVRCNHATFAGTTASPASNTAAFTPTYGAAAKSGAWCRLYVGGVFTAATVTPTGSWSLTVSSYDDTTGISTGSVTTSGATDITVGTCTITVPSGSTAAVSGQNDFFSPPGAGVTLTASGTGISYTSSGCSSFGISSGSNATYTGVVDITNLYVS